MAGKTTASHLHWLLLTVGLVLAGCDNSPKQVSMIARECNGVSATWIENQSESVCIVMNRRLHEFQKRSKQSTLGNAELDVKHADDSVTRLELNFPKKSLKVDDRSYNLDDGRTFVVDLVGNKGVEQLRQNIVAPEKAENYCDFMNAIKDSKILKKSENEK
jgi:hypothetical protein